MPRTNDEIILAELREMRKEHSDFRKDVEPILRMTFVHEEKISNLQKCHDALKKVPTESLKNTQLLFTTILAGTSIVGLIISVAFQIFHRSSKQ